MTLLTPDELAARWQVPVARVHALRRSGALAFIDLGDLGERARLANVRFKESDIEAFEELRRAYNPVDAKDQSERRGEHRSDQGQGSKAVRGGRHGRVDARRKAGAKGPLRVVAEGGDRAA